MRGPELSPELSGWHLSRQLTDKPTGLICGSCYRAAGEGCEAGCKLSRAGDLHIQLRGHGGDFREPDSAVAAAKSAADTGPELGGCLTLGAEVGECRYLHARAGLHVGARLRFCWLVAGELASPAHTLQSRAVARGKGLGEGFALRLSGTASAAGLGLLGSHGLQGCGEQGSGIVRGCGCGCGLAGVDAGHLELSCKDRRGGCLACF